VAISIFDNKEIVPNPDDLKEVLKENMDIWNDLINFLEDKYDSTTSEWKFQTKTAGWTYIISNKKKNLVYLSPNKKHFLVTVNMSIKISEIVLDMDLPNEIKDAINESSPCACGKYVLIKINKSKDLEYIKTILNLRDK
jgi:hypothetical protein